MLRVGLTGGLGSGKSTVAAMLARRGAYVISADEIGWELMRPGQAVYAAIAERFGAGVVRADGENAGELDRNELARLAFAEGRVEELNAIVHPAVIARQAEMTEKIGARDPEAVVVVESALVFETRYGGEDGWRRRFDRVILVVASEEMKVARFVTRQGGGADTTALEAEARRRLAQQISDEEKISRSDYVLKNEGSLEELEAQVEAIWPALVREARQQHRI